MYFLERYGADELIIVYETSLQSAIAFHSPVQTSSALPQLTELYRTLLVEPSEDKVLAKLRTRAEISSALSLLFHIGQAFPSQQTYYNHVHSLSTLQLDWNGRILRWVASLRAETARRNYAQLHLLTSESRVNSIFESLRTVDDFDQDLVKVALRTAINDLRQKLRGPIWSLLRSAYREFNLCAESTTRAWLAESLLLDSIAIDGIESVDSWMKDREQEGHCIAQMDKQGRWTLRRNP